MFIKTKNGFKLTFRNQYTFSAQFGESNKCANFRVSHFDNAYSPSQDRSPSQSRTAECAIIDDRKEPGILMNLKQALNIDKDFYIAEGLTADQIVELIIYAQGL